MEKTFLPSIVNKLLDDVENSFAENEQNDTLLSLHAIFNKIFESALDLIDSNTVTILQLKSCFTKADQFIIQVTSTSGTTYTLFHRINYCQCIFYQQKVLHSKSYPACKHFIAANLAYIWKKYRKFEIDFDVYKDYIENIVPTQSKS